MKIQLFGFMVILWSAIPMQAFAVSNSIMIVAVQTESATDASQEYIALNNTSNSAVDLSTWHVQYFSAATVDFSTPTRNIALTGIISPHNNYILATTGYMQDVAKVTFGATLASAGGHVRLISGSGSAEVQRDLLGWGTALHAETAPVSVAPKAHPYTRKQVNGAFIDTDNNATDFVTNLDVTITHVPAPITATTTPAPSTNPSLSPAPIPTPAPTTPSTSTPPTSTPQTPTASNSLHAVITEILPNPASPATDQTGEFIELYNPNQEPIDIGGYKLQSGNTFSYSYKLPSTILLPGHYVALYSDKTKLTLSNTSGKVRLQNPIGETVSETGGYIKAPSGSSWQMVNGVWGWTTTPTPGDYNQATTASSFDSASSTTSVSAGAAAKTTAAKSKAAKVAATSTPKASKTGKSSKVATPTGAKTAYSAPNSDKKPLPASPLLLASVAILAVGYMIYEYRHDLANKLAQFRRNRSLSRSAR